MKNNFKTRKELLKKITPEEKVLSKWLKKNKIRFTSQFIINLADKVYFVDFVIWTQKGLIGIEIDGGYHDEKQKYDLYRTENILKNKILKDIIRFENYEIIYTFDNVKKHILSLNPLFNVGKNKISISKKPKKVKKFKIPYTDWVYLKILEESKKNFK